MTKRKMLLELGVCFLMAGLAVQTFSQTHTSNRRSKLSDLERLQKMTEAERQRYAEQKRAQARLELERKQKEGQKTARERKLEREREQEEFRNRVAETKRELLHEKAALAVTEEQWKLIKPKLEKVRELQDRARSTVILSLASSSTSGSATTKSPSVPTWQWNVSWKDKDPNELTEAQKTANDLMRLLDRKDVAPGTLKRTMEALRKARREEAQIQIQSQLAEARRELREGVTTRQEAALVLMNWL